MKDSLEESTDFARELRDWNTALRADFDGCKLTSEANIQQWKDRYHQLERDTTEQRYNFDDRTNKLSKELKQRERNQQHVAAAQKSQIANLEHELGDTRSTLRDTR